ncbi:DUF4185 domain-containing protein [Williamsia deligens]|uniref:DUF4185 domain-containing protein n=1 Tax=Williamsia deligens TaxID=321325 RepID=A0ABW3G7G4_9NOCA|nr:DUF4185 domain-containing protein [Williamsia deligens]MCP2192694.1 protein of unknown function (DUF4185) [Williamsia deligens]
MACCAVAPFAVAAPAAAAPAAAALPSSGCVNDLPQPARPGSPLPPRIDFGLPYLQFKPVPQFGPQNSRKRIPSPAPPADPCKDPCPDITDPPPPAAQVGSGSGPIAVPKITFTPRPIATIPVPVPGGTPPPGQARPPAQTPPADRGTVTPKLGNPRAGGLQYVGQVTGHGSTSRTDKRFQVNGTDLGIMWEAAPDKVAVAFGDTFGKGFRPPGANGGDWRSNTLGFSGNRDLNRGLRIDSMVQDSRCHAAEVIASRKINLVEQTVIPTSGFALGKRQYMSYMSVKDFTVPGQWFTNYGGLAWSDDGGSTWTNSQYARWDNVFGQSKFQVSSMVPAGGYVYMFGTPNGRLGTTALARVPASDVLNKTAYQYWVNGTWRPTSNGDQATSLFGGPTGELSVRYDADSQLWQATYLDEVRGGIVLRQSKSPQGLWSEPTLLMSSAQHPQLYGGFMHPWSTGKDLYFTATTYTSYNVDLMHIRTN